MKRGKILKPTDMTKTYTVDLNMTPEDGSFNLIETFPEYGIEKAKKANPNEIRRRKDGYDWQKKSDGTWKRLPKGRSGKKDILSTISNGCNYVLEQTGNNYEMGRGYAKDGTPVFTQKGEESRILFTREQMAKVKGGHLVHNHPSGGGFSQQDIALALVNDVTIWATSPGRSFAYIPDVMKTHKDVTRIPLSAFINSGGGNVSFEDRKKAYAVTEAKNVYDAVFKVLNNQVMIGMISVKEAEAAHDGAFADAVKSRLGGTFKEFKWVDGVLEELPEPFQKSNGNPTMPRGLVTNATEWRSQKLQGQTKFQGLPVSIENAQGTYRQGVDRKGKQWRTFMHIPYGYVRASEGTDGDHVDVYLGPATTCPKVHIIHQVNPYTGAYDEDKVMLGFHTEAEAKAAYLRQYDSPKYFGTMTVTDMAEFKKMLKEKRGMKLKKSLEKSKYISKRRGKNGKWIYKYADPKPVFHKKLIEAGREADRLAEITYSDSTPEEKNKLKQARRRETLYRHKLMNLYGGDVGQFHIGHSAALKPYVDAMGEELRERAKAVKKSKDDIAITVDHLSKHGLYVKGKTHVAIDPKQLKMGIKVELEHSPDEEIARQIALDHLVEDKDYYTHLAEMEAKYKGNTPHVLKKAEGFVLQGDGNNEDDDDDDDDEGSERDKEFEREAANEAAADAKKSRPMLPSELLKAKAATDGTRSVHGGKKVIKQAGKWIPDTEGKTKKTDTETVTPGKSEKVETKAYKNIDVKDFIKARDEMVPPQFEAFVTKYSPKEYEEKGAKFYMSGSGKSGFAITKDGDLISVFSAEGAHEGGDAIRSAIKQGAKTLDCLGPVLPKVYEKFGFKVKETLAWDDQYAPPNWNYGQHGRPSVYMMEYGGDEEMKKSINGNNKHFNNLSKEYAKHLFGDEVKDLFEDSEEKVEKSKYIKKFYRNGRWNYVYANTAPRKPRALPQMSKERNLGGTTGGAFLVRLQDGSQKVMKRSTGPAHLKEEYMANRIYKILGAAVPKVDLYDSPKGPTQLADHIQGTPLGDLSGLELDAAHDNLRQHFVADALLGNWDALGMDMDNVLWDGKKAYRIDNGGSMRYRAQGAPKGDKFGGRVLEISTLRKPERKAAVVYGKVTDDEVREQVRAVVAKRSEILHAIDDPKLRKIMDARISDLESTWMVEKSIRIYKARRVRGER